MIIEFLGIPGSGKTYHANLLKQQMKNEGTKYIDISRYKGTPLLLKVLYKVYDFAILVLPKYRKQFWKYKKICLDSQEEPNYIPLSLDSCIKDIVLYSLVYDLFRFSKKVIVNDEGQLHRLVFLAVQFNVSFEKLLSVYMQYRDDVSIRYIKTSSELALKNIKYRNRSICAMDKMKNDVLIDYVNSFEDVCNKLECHNYDFVSVITSNTNHNANTSLQ